MSREQAKRLHHLRKIDERALKLATQGTLQQAIQAIMAVSYHTSSTCALRELMCSVHAMVTKNTLMASLHWEKGMMMAWLMTFQKGKLQRFLLTVPSDFKFQHLDYVRKFLICIQIEIEERLLSIPSML